MKSIRLAIAALIFIVLIPGGVATAEDFSELLDEVWEWQLAENPTFASRLGDRRYNDQWADRSVTAVDRRHDQNRVFLRRLYALDRSQLSDDDKLNYELFRYLRFETFQDYADWLARLGKIDAVIAQTIDVAEAGRKAGYMPPRILMERVPDQLAKQLVDDPADSPFMRIFDSMPDSIATEDQERIRSEALETVAKTVLPAYRKLDKYFVGTYLPACRESIGLSALPNGSAWYEHRARSYTTTKMTPDEIHRLGLSEVRRIRDQMQAIIDELEFAGSFQDFLVFLRTDPQFYFDSPEELYKEYLATSKRIDPELVRLFGALPRMPYGVKPIPDSIAPDTTTAYYSRPAGDGSRAGIYWVNLYKPEVRPKYEIEVLTVHEAMPGHHLQIALQQELGELPNFRRYSGFTAFIEGWGLYSEALGYDLGLYTDPYSRFGQLTYEMWRAVRLVVDTGIHYKGWTRQQAIDFFKDNAAKTELDIVNEIDRYIGNSAQALAYKIGQLKMLALRERAENMLGDSFDVRAFHDAMLGSGALPLDILEQRVGLWILEQR